jgi:hypothetical protein
MGYKFDPTGHYAKIGEKWVPVQTDKKGGKFIECKACFLTDTVDGDLDANYHKGITIGERGKVLYWYFIWHGRTTGNATVVTPEITGSKQYISGDQIIRIHLITD